MLAADSPLLTFRMLELFRAAGLPELVAGYLGEPALFTVQKTTLRKADPAVPGAWHQDGAFLGDVRALNLWLALSRCGDEAPGLDIVPRRLDGFVTTQTDEAVLSYQVSQRMAEEAAGATAIVRPIFEPGDALFFDELFLHQTGSDPGCRGRASRSRTGSSAPRGSRASSRRWRSSVSFDPYRNDPQRWGVSLAQSAEIMLPCLDAAAARSVVEVGAFAGDLTARAGGLGRRRRRTCLRDRPGTATGSPGAGTRPPGARADP